MDSPVPPVQAVVFPNSTFLLPVAYYINDLEDASKKIMFFQPKQRFTGYFHVYQK